MKRVLVTVAAVAATAVVGTAVPLGLSLTAAGSEQPPSPVTGTVTRADKRDAQGPPAWAHQKPRERRDAAKARWKIACKPRVPAHNCSARPPACATTGRSLAIIGPLRRAEMHCG